MILVAGATGKVGSKLIANLKATDDAVRAFVRSEQKGEDLGVDYAVGDFNDPASMDKALEGVDRAFLASSAAPEQVSLQNAFVDACQRADVKHVVKLSSLGADRDVPARFIVWQRDTERRLEDSKMGWTLLRPHGFNESVLEFADGVRERATVEAPMGDGAVPWVDTRDVAEFAAAVLRAPTIHAGQTYELTGPEPVSMEQLAEQLSELTGKRVTYKAIEPAEYKEKLTSAGVDAWRADGLVELYSWYQNGDSTVQPLLPVMLGRPARTMQAFLEEHRAEFGA